MPILARQPDLFPDDLFDWPRAVGTNTTWWVMYTMSRREKELMRRLHSAEIAFYSPLVRQRKAAPSGRIRSAYLPLFPGYVFFHGDEDARRTALTTNCVSRCLPVGDGRQLWHDLRQIHRLIESQVALTPESRLEPGQRVRLCGGPLLGLEGTVIKRHGQQRLLVAVEFLQQGASVQIDNCGVERID